MRTLSSYLKVTVILFAFKPVASLNQLLFRRNSQVFTMFFCGRRLRLVLPLSSFRNITWPHNMRRCNNSFFVMCNLVFKIINSGLQLGNGIIMVIKPADYRLKSGCYGPVYSTNIGYNLVSYVFCGLMKRRLHEKKSISTAKNSKHNNRE